MGRGGVRRAAFSQLLPRVRPRACCPVQQLAKQIGGLSGITGAFVLYTLLLLVQYQAFMHGLRGVIPYPDTPDGLWLARFRSPFIILDWWLNRS